MQPQAITLTEGSTSFPAVSWPTGADGPGWHCKCNMGWMHDTLLYLTSDPIHRKQHHSEMTFGIVCAYTEYFVPPLSYDGFVHGKCSLLAVIRRGHDDTSLVIVVCNFTPSVHTGCRSGVPHAGAYNERLNTDSVHCGGSNAGTPSGMSGSQPVPWQSKPQSVLLTAPPLATVILEEWQA